MNLRPFGLRRDTGRHPRMGFAQLRGKLSAAPRGHADLKPFTGPVLEQPGVGSCVMNGTPGAACTTLAAQGKPLGFTPSVSFGYQMALRLDRAADYPLRKPEDMPKLVDRGTQILTGVLEITHYGVKAMGPNVVIDGWVYQTDCGPNEAVDEAGLNVAALVKASTKLLVGAFEIDGGPERKAQMKLALDAGYSLSVGGWWDTAAMSYSAGDPPIGATDRYDLDGGGHCTELCGYVTDAAGVTLWLIKNSWGVWWGDGGYAWVTDAFVDGLWEVFAMSVEVKS